MRWLLESFCGWGTGGQPWVIRGPELSVTSTSQLQPLLPMSNDVINHACVRKPLETPQRMGFRRLLGWRFSWWCTPECMALWALPPPCAKHLFHLLILESEVAQSGLTLCDPWTVAHQASLSMGFSRQEYWSGLPFPSPGDLPDAGIEPRSPTLQADTLTSAPPGKLRCKS